MPISAETAPPKMATCLFQAPEVSGSAAAIGFGGSLMAR